MSTKQAEVSSNAMSAIWSFHQAHLETHLQLGAAWLWGRLTFCVVVSLVQGHHTSKRDLLLLEEIEE